MYKRQEQGLESSRWAEAWCNMFSFDGNNKCDIGLLENEKLKETAWWINVYKWSKPFKNDKECVENEPQLQCPIKNIDNRRDGLQDQHLFKMILLLDQQDINSRESLGNYNLNKIKN